jgi:hypothetical protein
MKITITPYYIVTILGLLFLWISAIVLNAESWISFTLFCFLVQSAGHEWTHVIMAKNQKLEIEELHLDRGSGYLAFRNYYDGREARVFLIGFVWDLLLYSLMIMAMILYGSYLSLCVAIGMIGLFYYSMTFDHSDWQMFKKAFKVI